MRKITINDEIWSVFIGKSNAVIHNPRTEKKSIVSLDKITGRPLELIERGRRKKTEDGMVKPSDIRSFIEKEYLVEDEK